jgi:hypothetical protein
MQAIVQTPPEHPGVPLAALQTFLHTPQLLTESRMSISQPLAALPSQFASPALHVMSLQTPPLHEGVPPWLEHALVHDPQLCTVRRLVSQPLSGFPSQLPHPAVQTMPHTPAVHVELPLVELHTWPHWPHELGLFRSASQPLSTLPSQFIKPGLHAI